MSCWTWFGKISVMMKRKMTEPGVGHCRSFWWLWGQRFWGRRGGRPGFLLNQLGGDFPPRWSWRLLLFGRACFLRLGGGTRLPRPLTLVPGIGFDCNWRGSWRLHLWPLHYLVFQRQPLTKCHPFLFFFLCHPGPPPPNIGTLLQLGGHHPHHSLTSPHIQSRVSGDLTGDRMIPSILLLLLRVDLVGVNCPPLQSLVVVVARIYPRVDRGCVEVLLPAVVAGVGPRRGRHSLLLRQHCHVGAIGAGGCGGTQSCRRLTSSPVPSGAIGGGKA